MNLLQITIDTARKQMYRKVWTSAFTIIGYTILFWSDWRVGTGVLIIACGAAAQAKE